MQLRRIVAAGLIILLPGGAGAQTAKPDQADDRTIVVTGDRDANGRRIPMSDWHVAETQHVMVYGRGNPAGLSRVAHNLEKLHFLLTMLFDRVDAPDEAAKLSVTMIGDRSDFNHLDLKNMRWQQGPYPRAFPKELYYDPREDGAVLATSAEDQMIMLQPGVPLSSIDLAAAAGPGPARMPGAPEPPQTARPSSLALDSTGVKPAGEISHAMSAEGRLYAGFAQHYVMTYFPNAYPRWYLQGLGEIFATFNADGEGVLEYGRQPPGFREVNEWYGRYPVKRILSGDYLHDKWPPPEWTPYRAWALVHLLFFSEEWKEPLNRYFAAVARGESAERAAAAFGDLDVLQKQLAGYSGRGVPYERLTYPAERVSPPMVRRLRKSEAVLVRGRLELGSRLEIPPAAGPGAPPAEAAKADEARRKAIAKRDRWIADLREDASRNPGELGIQLLLAESECRSGNVERCLRAADNALALAPQDPTALSWKGIALVHQAIGAPASRRAPLLREARSFIVKANRADPDAALPLLAYYRSYADAGQTPPDIAVEGLAKVVDLVPAAPGPRLLLGRELAKRGATIDARRILLPVAAGAFDTPERADAQSILSRLQPATSGS